MSTDETGVSFGFLCFGGNGERFVILDYGFVWAELGKVLMVVCFGTGLARGR